MIKAAWGCSGNQHSQLWQPVWACVGGIEVLGHLGLKASMGKNREFP